MIKNDVFEVVVQALNLMVSAMNVFAKVDFVRLVLIHLEEGFVHNHSVRRIYNYS
jgi:hypothetical protein